MTDRPAEAPLDENAADALRPVRVGEQTVDPAVWESWVESARSATDKGLLWGGTVSVVVGMLSAAIGLMLLLPSPAAAVVLAYAPAVGWIVWRTVSTRVRSRLFTPTANAMRDLMVPDLLRTPSDDVLRVLASRGNALLTSEYTVARVEDRLDLYVIRIFEYAPEHLPWGGGTESSSAGPM